ncbi:MAG: FAD-dependent oxidoreductase [Deltaproteobacteria bacterium]|jgi:NADPH-dependent glutamate synthase beta subunit-like oxidoreductase/ferredoxin
MTDYKTPHNKIPLFLPHSSTSTAANKTGSWRYVRPVYDEKTSPCSAACPAGEDIARIEMLLSRNLIQEAWETILEENPFPAVCGRVCFHNCEGSCNRGQMDEPVAIHQLERFIGDAAISTTEIPEIKTLPGNGKKVAIVGSGPAGLGAAYFLVRLGFACEVFEAASEPGGILRWGIPTYRLPRGVLQKEIRRIKELGVTLNCRTPVNAEMLKTFKTRYDAVFIGCGHGRAIDLQFEGAQKAINGLQFLHNIRARHEMSLNSKRTAAVIGGGNTAIDVARTLVRLGIDAVIVYRRRRQDMPAFDPELQMALDEGVTLKELLTPINIKGAGGDPAGRQTPYLVTLQKMKVSATPIEGRARVIPDGDNTEMLKIDYIFSAIGAEPEAAWHQAPAGKSSNLDLSHCKLIKDDMPIACGGDPTNRVKSVADAIASGKQAAMALDTYFKSGWDAVSKVVAGCQVGLGPAVSMAMYLDQERTNRNPQIVSFSDINTHYFKSASRVNAPVLPPGDRIQSFLPVESTLKRKAAIEESERCFNCGICNACDYCRLYCPEMSVMVEDERRHINLDYCKGCGLCVAECPRNAMALKEENI